MRGHRPRDLPPGGRARRPATPTCGRPSASTPTTPPTLGRRVGRRSRPWPATTPTSWSAIGEAGLRPLLRALGRATSRRSRSAPRSQLAHRARPRARDPLARRVGRHVPRARRRRRARRARSSTASPAGPTKRDARSTSARTSRSAASCRSRTPTTCAPRPRSCRSTACSSRPTRRTSRRCRTAASRTRPAWVVDVGAALAAAMGRPVDEVAAGRPAGTRRRSSAHPRSTSTDLRARRRARSLPRRVALTTVAFRLRSGWKRYSGDATARHADARADPITEQLQRPAGRRPVGRGHPRRRRAALPAHVDERDRSVARARGTARRGHVAARARPARPAVDRRLLDDATPVRRPSAPTRSTSPPSKPRSSAVAGARRAARRRGLAAAPRRRRRPPAGRTRCSTPTPSTRRRWWPRPRRSSPTPWPRPRPARRRRPPGPSPTTPPPGCRCPSPEELPAVTDLLEEGPPAGPRPAAGTLARFLPAPRVARGRRRSWCSLALGWRWVTQQPTAPAGSAGHPRGRRHPPGDAHRRRVRRRAARRPQHVSLGPGDVVVPSASSALHDGLHVDVLRVLPGHRRRRRQRAHRAHGRDQRRQAGQAAGSRQAHRGAQRPRPSRGRLDRRLPHPRSAARSRSTTRRSPSTRRRARSTSCCSRTTSRSVGDDYVDPAARHRPARRRRASRWSASAPDRQPGHAGDPVRHRRAGRPRRSPSARPA